MEDVFADFLMRKYEYNDAINHTQNLIYSEIVYKLTLSVFLCLETVGTAMVSCCPHNEFHV